MSEEKSASLRGLFVGNSFTYFNDMPAMLERMSSGDFQVAGRCLKGGQNLKGHSEDEKTAVAFGNTNFSHLIIQDHSCTSGLLLAEDTKLQEAGHATLQTVTDYFAPAVVTAVKQAAANADSIVCNTVVFYSTWGHRGVCIHEKYREEYKDFKTMNTKIQRGYELLAKRFAEAVQNKCKLNVVISPVGRAFEIIYDQCCAQREDNKRDPSDDPQCLYYRLYQPDKFHPSKLGTYLAACVFFATLYQKDPRTLVWYPEDTLTDFDVSLQDPKRFGHDFKPEVCDAETAAILRLAAYSAVFGKPRLKL